MIKRKKIVVMDAGLKEYGGHHPSILEVLSKSSYFREGEVCYEIYSNIAIDDDLKEHLLKAGFSILPYFSTDFYSNFYNYDSRLNYYNDYIIQLSKEYYFILDSYKGRKVDFLHHTLNWDHAYALGLAISLFEKNNKDRVGEINHIVLLMFSPKANIYNEPIQAAKYKLGFRTLERCESVRIFSSDYELTEKYLSILSSDFGRYPCFLISEDKLNEVDKKKAVKKYFIISW
ncbi:hypothetical protein HJ057_16655 [Vibrio parahaemolyticus]|nr:hypothetical protein [Vibrio parahaemolyticus]